MQIATIEFARNVLKLPKAHSTEFDLNTPDPVIAMLDEQTKVTKKGGTMRLGAQPCQLVVGTKTARLYGAFVINERHRHRYEFNNAYRAQFEKAGLAFSGFTPDGQLIEIIELPNWFSDSRSLLRAHAHTARRAMSRRSCLPAKSIMSAAA